MHRSGASARWGRRFACHGLRSRPHFIPNLNRPLNHRSARNPQHRHPIQKRRIQRRKSIPARRKSPQIHSRRARIYLLDPLRHSHRQLRLGHLKIRSCNPRDVRESPLFVVRSREAQLREPLEAGFAHLPQPLRRRPLIRKALKPRASLFRYGSHTLPTASSSSAIPSPA